VLEYCLLCPLPPHNQIEDIPASLTSSWTVGGESELFVLASSLFDSIDIEGVESGAIKIGGIAGSSNLADQDGQGGWGNGLVVELRFRALEPVPLGQEKVLRVS
jgi:hypothetical protein